MCIRDREGSELVAVAMAMVVVAMELGMGMASQPCRCSFAAWCQTDAGLQNPMLATGRQPGTFSVK